LEEKDIIINKPVSEYDDSQLMRMLAAGNKPALAELMKRYRVKAINFSYRYLGDFDDAEDAAQDCFVKVYYNCKRFDPDKPFSPWFYTILVNCCRDRLRQKNLFVEFIERYKLQQDIDKTPSAGKNDDFAEYFSRALMKLTPAKREIITLRFTQDMSYQEIAETLNISQGTVMSRLFRAKKELEKILTSMGIYV